MSECRLYQGDCLEVMGDMEDGSVDTVITDPPYGTTACKWDSVIPLEPMWAQLRRVCRPRGAIVIFGSDPFSSVLIGSNFKGYRHKWYWEKNRGGNFAVLKYMPYSVVEEVMVFSGSGEGVDYHPQMVKGENRGIGGRHSEKHGRGFVSSARMKHIGRYESSMRHPRNLLSYSTVERQDSLHPSQKPVPLMEYLIRTYTMEGETVLDFAMGSGTAGVACYNLDRNFIGIEKDADYFKIAQGRIDVAKQQPKLL